MKRPAWSNVTLVVGFILVFTGAALGQGRVMHQGQMGQPGQAAAPSSRGPAGMMGPGMGHEMMGGMTGGGMRESPQATSPQTAERSQNLTQQDTQGAVTVIATLLTPAKPRPDGKLAVGIKLDTHAVDLDQYPLEKVVVLRGAQGEEVPALALESGSGSGHHREGVLVFPAMDARGKPILTSETTTLSLILRGIGGVQERVLRWEIPLG